MPSLEEALDECADRTGFSGVVQVDRAGHTEVAKAYGLADRAHGIAVTAQTQFGIASGTKGFTALTVISLVQEGTLTLATTARSILGEDLPLIGDDVTIEHLLAHRSGIGDYFDEEAMESILDYALPVPVHELAGTEGYRSVLDGHPMVFPPGERFVYNNGGFVVLALIAERLSGVAFHELVEQRVCEPAGLADTAFLRSDELPGTAAIGYLGAGPRTNVLHLPVRGNGDGGLYSTAGDVRALWVALLAGRIVEPSWVAEMVRPRSEGPEEPLRYGLGFWLAPEGPGLELHGYDAGVSFRTRHDPETDTTVTVVSNTSEGTWPMEDVLDGVTR